MNRVGSCNRCGECCEIRKDWSVFLRPFDVESKVTEACPFLQGKKGNRVRECGIFHSHHGFWEDKCSGFPSPEKSLYEVVSLFKNVPGCSYEFVEK